MVMTRLLSIDKDCLSIDERVQMRAKKIALLSGTSYITDRMSHIAGIN